jgi:hypothetical protein
MHSTRDDNDAGASSPLIAFVATFPADALDADEVVFAFSVVLGWPISSTRARQQERKAPRGIWGGVGEEELPLALAAFLPAGAADV